MPNITTISSFTDEPVKIPNAVNESAGVDDNAGLDAVIVENERSLLKEVLGETQYEALLVELNKLPFNPQSGVNADQDYIDLVNGSGAWQGLKPMLTNYIFCAWLKTTEVVTTMVGSGKGKTQGFTVADNSSKYAERWNVFVKNLEEVLEYLEASNVFELPVDVPYYETTNSLGL